MQVVPAETERACSRAVTVSPSDALPSRSATTRKDAEPIIASATAFLKAVAAMVAFRRIMRFRCGLSLCLKRHQESLARAFA
jgi:hypothetical protein